MGDRRLHPHDAKDGLGTASRPCSAEPEVVAVGECGLDYHYDHSPDPGAAARVVRRPDPPVPTPTRLLPARGPHPRGVGDTFDILAAEGVPDVRWSTASPAAPDEARPVPRPRRAHLSFSGVVTFPRAPPRFARRSSGARSTACWSRPTRPFLAPVPHRAAQPTGVRHPGRRDRGRRETRPAGGGRRGHLGQRRPGLRPARRATEGSARTGRAGNPRPAVEGVSQVEGSRRPPRTVQFPRGDRCLDDMSKVAVVLRDA